MNINLCSNRIHNSPHHRSCRPHCWFHHDRTHLQPRDAYQQHTSHDDSICMLNNYLFWHSADNNLHYHSCSLRCWLRHYNNRPQQSKDTDNLYWKKTLVWEGSLFLRKTIFCILPYNVPYNFYAKIPSFKVVLWYFYFLSDFGVPGIILLKVFNL